MGGTNKYDMGKGWILIDTGLDMELNNMDGRSIYIASTQRESFYKGLADFKHEGGSLPDYAELYAIGDDLPRKGLYIGLLS